MPPVSRLGGTWSANPALHDAVDRACVAWASVANVTFQKISIGDVDSQSGADIAVVLTGNELGAEIDAVRIFPDPACVDRAFGERTNWRPDELIRLRALAGELGAARATGTKREPRGAAPQC